MNKNMEGYISNNILSELENRITTALNRCGIYYRIFSRLKNQHSIEEKIKRKKYSFTSENLMQDLIGIRIALYFADDVDICKKIIQNSFAVVGCSISQTTTTEFSAERLNVVCAIPSDFITLISPDIWRSYPIDQTFEIQIRTVFSEGWHEIEHDVRYKSNADWENNSDLSRNLNGILATLETCDWSILEVLNNMAYREYKNHRWAAMLKSKLRIHLIDFSLDSQIIDIFNAHPEIAKQFFRIDRDVLLEYLACNLPRNIPLTLNNLVYLMNNVWIHCEEIDAVTPILFHRTFIKE